MKLVVCLVHCERHSCLLLQHIYFYASLNFQIAPFDPTRKKKKKKVVIQDPGDDYVDALLEKTKSLSGTKFISCRHIYFFKFFVSILMMRSLMVDLSLSFLQLLIWH